MNDTFKEGYEAALKDCQATMFASRRHPMPLIDKIKWIVDTTCNDPKRSEFHRGWSAACEMVLACIKVNTDE